MDISKISHGIKVVLGGSIAFLIVSIFNWQEVEFAGIASAGVSMWHGWGVLAGILAIAIVVWEGLRLANVKLEIGLTPAMVTAALSVLLVVFTVLKFLVSNEFRTFWAFIGVLLAIFVAVGAFMNMKELGHSLEDMGNEMKAAAGSAAAAAKTATDKNDAAAPAPAEASAPTEAPAATEASAPAEAEAPATEGEQPPSAPA